MKIKSSKKYIPMENTDGVSSSQEKVYLMKTLKIV